MKSTKNISFAGTVAVSVGSSSPTIPLRGVLVDVYRVERAADGKYQFQRLNKAGALTSTTGDFSFTSSACPVEAQEITLATPPYTPFEYVNPASLPTLVFRISVDAEVLVGVEPAGTEFVEIFDERTVVDATWIAAHPERVHVQLTGNPPIAVVVPEGIPEAMAVAGIVAPPSTVPGSEFHFLRIGRVIRAEIGELGDPRADFTHRAGYMTSTNKQTPSAPSFFPDVIDAPFGGTLHIGGYFGADFQVEPLASNLYYTVSFWSYTGALDSPFDRAFLSGETRLQDPLFNKKYLLPTPALPNGQWQTLNLGPFDGTITDPPGGGAVKVYKRPPLQQPLTEYWPFWDLMAIWSSGAAPNHTIVFTLEAYEKVGGDDLHPQLRKLTLTPSVNDHLPLTIDNRLPVLKLFDWRTGVARFATNDVVATLPFDPCSEMTVATPEADRNECIVVKYSIEDGEGNPHPHVSWYSLGVLYTPKQVTGAPLETYLPLRDTFGSGAKLNDAYSPSIATAPVFNIANKESVLVPVDIDGWPPESHGDPTSGGAQCEQYALAVGARCAVRTTDGWGALYGTPRLDRHIIVRRTP